MSTAISLPLLDSVPIESIHDANVLFMGLAEKTRVDYVKALKRAVINGLQFPCDHRAVADYIDKLATGNYSTGNRAIQARGCTIGTIKAYCAAVTFWHSQVLRIPSPCAHPVVIAKLKTLSRAHASRPLRQAKPLMKTDIEQISSESKDNKSVRDNALISIGFNGCLRRSELTGIKFEHLTWHDQGVEIRLPVTKTAINDSVAIPCSNSGYSSLVQLIDCLKQNGISSGFIFLAVTKRGKFLKGKALSTQSVNKVLKARCNAVGMDNTLVSGHSLRSGCATELSIHNVAITTIARHGRWKSTDMVIRYCRVNDQFKDNALNVL